MHKERFSAKKTKAWRVSHQLTRPSRPIRCAVWIVERMHYPTDRPTNRQTDRHSQLQRCVGAPKNALIQHIKRSVYQTGIWATSFETQASLPAASLFGWQKKANQWQPVWINIAEVALSCRNLVKCGCKTDCSTIRCSCKSADLPCTELCKCKCVQGNMEVNQ